MGVRGVPMAMQEETVMRAWILYSVHRFSLRECAERLIGETGYASPASMVQAIRRQFIHRGLELRPVSCGKQRRHLRDQLADEMYADHERGLSVTEIAAAYADRLPAGNVAGNRYHVRRAFRTRGLEVTSGRGRWKRVAS